MYKTRELWYYISEMSGLSKAKLIKRQEQIIRCVKLGMELVASMYTLGLTAEEMELLEKDEAFLHRVKVAGAILEMNLLEKHEDATRLQIAEGKTTAVQWKLERINPKRWGKSQQDEGPAPSAVVIVELPGIENMGSNPLEAELEEDGDDRTPEPSTT